MTKDERLQRGTSWTHDDNMQVKFGFLFAPVRNIASESLYLSVRKSTFYLQHTILKSLPKEFMRLLSSSSLRQF